MVRFSFWQAFLSALLSVVPAIFLARALYRRRFPGRLALLRLCAMTLILPVLVAVFGILSVYGRQGWLASLCQSLGLEWTFSPYGLQGILLAHVFFNLPMASRLLLQALDRFPANNVSLPPSLGCAAGIFSASSNGRGYGDKSRRLLCLLLYALFRQLRHRTVAGRRSAGDHYRAGNLSGAELRLRSCPRGDAGADPDGVLPWAGAVESKRLSKAIAPGTTLLQGWRDPDDRCLHSRICDTVLIVLALLLLLPPLLAVIVDGVNRQLPEVLAQPVLWQCCGPRCVLRWRQAYCAWC